MKTKIIIIAIVVVALIVIIFVSQDIIASVTSVLAGAGATAALLKDKWARWDKAEKDKRNEIEVQNTLIDNLDDSDLSSEIDSAIKRRNRKARKN